MTPKFEYFTMQSNRPLLGALIATGVLQLIFCFLAWAKRLIWKGSMSNTAFIWATIQNTVILFCLCGVSFLFGYFRSRK